MGRKGWGTGTLVACRIWRSTTLYRRSASCRQGKKQIILNRVLFALFSPHPPPDPLNNLRFCQDGKVVDAKNEKIGIRRARIVQDPLEDEEGRTFLFEINNVRMFCGGAFLSPTFAILFILHHRMLII
jgi:hypothetical protein